MAELSSTPPTTVQNPQQGELVQQGTCGTTTPVNIPGSTGTTNSDGNVVGPFTNYYCPTVTQKTEWQVGAMVGLVWYPLGRDYFPRKNGLHIYGRDLIPSFLMGTSVTSLGNAVGAINFEPISGLDFYAGVGSANSTRLSNFTTPIGSASATTAPTLPVVTSVHAGLALGVGLDLSIFSSIFSKASSTGISMP
jgi:hypothetical protein